MSAGLDAGGGCSRLSCLNGTIAASVLFGQGAVAKPSLLPASVTIITHLLDPPVSAHRTCAASCPGMALNALRVEVAMLEDLSQQLAVEATEIHAVRGLARYKPPAPADPPCK